MTQQKSPTELERCTAFRIHMEDCHIAHLAGMVDAVGNITADIAKGETKLGYRYTPTVTIHRPKDQTLIMGKLDAYCDDYGIKYHITERSGPDVNVFRVSDPESIKRFLAPMLEYLVVKHEAASIMLDKVLPLLAEDAHLTREGFLEVMDWTDKMRQTRYGNEPKYTKQYFEEELQSA